jgi:ATP-dependent DNA ligase
LHEYAANGLREAEAADTDKCAFVNLPETGRAHWGEILEAEKMKNCVWVRPELVTVVEFLEWAEGDRLRHSKFVALHDDKDPREMIKEANKADSLFAQQDQRIHRQRALRWNPGSQ